MRFCGLLLTGLLALPGVASAGMSRADTKVNQATTLIVQQRFMEAEPLLRKAIAIDPSNAAGQYNLGVVGGSTGRPDEAIAHNRAAYVLFGEQARPVDGEASLAQALYGIALAEEDRQDPRAAAAAWDEYIRFARGYEIEQPAVAIARNHLDGQMRAANMRPPYPFGPQTATRPHTQQ
jgi:tetratricopeptide (TPR) repeat protein